MNDNSMDTTSTAGRAVTAWVGVDISKDTFDACLKTDTGYRQRQFANTTAGFLQLLSWTEELAPLALCHICLESTGPYSQPLALFLVEHDQKVSVVNPSRVKHAALARGTHNKTDAADARLLCDYCWKEAPSLWRVAAPEVRELLSLLRRLDEIAAHRQQEMNRLESVCLPKHVLHSVKNTIQFLDKETRRLEKQVKDHVDRHPGLQEDLALLESIPGIGSVTALRLLAEMPDVDRFASAKQAASYAGLAPREHRSGTSVHRRTRIGKAGNGRLRKAMYYPAMTAVKHNPLIHAFYHRLLDRGLCKMAALTACMRKLLMIAFGVLKHRTPFSPQGYQPAS